MHVLTLKADARESYTWTLYADARMPEWPKEILHQMSLHAVPAGTQPSSVIYNFMYEHKIICSAIPFRNSGSFAIV